MDSDYADTEIPGAVSFLDLIDALVVDRMRAHRVSMQHIRKVHSLYCKEWDTDHPFCTKNFYIDTVEKRIVERIGRKKGSSLLVDALKKQGQIEEVILPSLESIVYGKKFAEVWKIARGISINPKIQLGKPVLDGTRIPTYAIASQYYAYDEDASSVASVYRIGKKAVLDAVKFESDRGTVKQAA